MRKHSPFTAVCKCEVGSLVVYWQWKGRPKCLRYGAFAKGQENGGRPTIDIFVPCFESSDVDFVGQPRRLGSRPSNRDLPDIPGVSVRPFMVADLRSLTLAFTIPSIVTAISTFSFFLVGLLSKISRSLLK